MLISKESPTIALKTEFVTGEANRPVNHLVRDIYRRLFDQYGPQHWWPAEEPFEVMVGAILTQSTAWVNVEKAIANLKAAGVLSPQALCRLTLSDLAIIIRPSGYYNAKAKKLQALVRWVGECGNDNLDKIFDNSIDKLRQQLLGIWGVGPETADSIILYAANKPIFVIDAYTRRIVDRVGLRPDGDSYSAYQSLFMDNLPLDAGLFNEYHALLVCLGKNVCRKRHVCQSCCLQSICRSNTND